MLIAPLFITWNGVWIASNLNDSLNKVVWKRYAGLNEALGLTIVDDVIYVTGKDQITRLHDLMMVKLTTTRTSTAISK